MRHREVCACGGSVDVDADDPAIAVRDWRARHVCPPPLPPPAPAAAAPPVSVAVAAAPRVGFTRPPGANPDPGPGP